MNDNATSTNAPITPDDARISLADAHVGMTTAEISEHATCLAAVIVSQEEFIRSNMELINSLQELTAVQSRCLHNISIALRHVASLSGDGKKRAARLALADLRRDLLPVLSAPKPPVFNTATAFVPMLDAWPDAFTPKGTKHGR